jgi:hypothetical protein
MCPLGIYLNLRLRSLRQFLLKSDTRFSLDYVLLYAIYQIKEIFYLNTETV